MAYSAWVASNPYTVGAIARATTVQASGLVFRCTVAGTSAATQPAWPTDIGSTIVDGGVTWAAISSVYEELSVLAPSAIIELFQLELVPVLHDSSDIYYFHAGVNAAVSGNIVFAGDTYVRLPIEVTGFEFSSSGSLPRPTLTVSNLGGELSAVLLEVNSFTPGNDLGGAIVTRIRTLKKYLDGEPTSDPFATGPQEIWYIDRKSAETRDAVQWELASKFDLAGIFLPKRQLIANVCQWQYRSAECSYTGSNYFDINNNVVATQALDRCGKRLSSCKLRFGDTNPLPFGSFPGAGLTQ
jgi:lambda family phage minor tail protein L